LYQENWISKLERKYRRYAIRNLMTLIVAGMAIVYLIDLVASPMSRFSLSSMLAFNRSAIQRGQIWRLITFVFIPPNASMLFILFSLYFYWLIGSALENQWGSFRFNLYYLCGMLGTAVSGMITGYATNYYLNLSLFLAFAILWPNFEIRLFGILPVRIKWLALIDAASLVWMLLTDSMAGKVALLVAMVNVLLFFGGDLIAAVRQMYRRYQFKKNWR